MTTPAVTSTKVVEAWLKTLAAVDATKVGPSLPSDSTLWAATGFWQVTTVGGNPHVDLRTHRPVVEVSCWAATASAEHPPYNRAESMAQAVADAALVMVNRRLTVLAANDTVLVGLWPIGEPIRVPDPTTGYARVSVLIQANWGLA